MKRRALILIEGNFSGNGRMFVRVARRLGLVPIMLSRNPARYEYVAADKLEALVVDTKEVSSVIQACEGLQSNYEIAGVTCASEAYYWTVAVVCRHFALPGPNPEAVARCLNKLTQRQQLAKAGVPIPEFRAAADTAAATEFAAEIGLPVVLKPIVGNGSYGVKLCRTLEEVAEQTAFVLAGKHGLPSPSMVLVEEFAVGEHFGCEVMEGAVVGIIAVDCGPPPNFALREFVFPAPLSSDDSDLLAAVARRSIEALALDWGPVNIELRLTRRGPVVIEVNPRIGGAPDPALIRLGCGVDLIEETIKLFTGQQAVITKSHSQAAAARYVMPDSGGILKWLGDQRRARAVPGVSAVELKAKSGTPIVLQGDYRDVIAHVVTVSSDAAAAATALQRAVELMEWTMLPFPEVEEQQSA